MNEQEFAQLVVDLLDEQQKYFRSKGDDRTILLIRCKGMEARVRREAIAILNRQEKLPL